MRMDLSEIAKTVRAVGDFEDHEDAVLTRVCTDSREVRHGDLFVCLAGDNFDGHNFAAEAAKRKAGAILAHKPLPDISGVPVLLVRDTLLALGDLAGYWRDQTEAHVIGITGSAGKTTTKELLYAALSGKGKTGKNYKNFNNQIGLPLSLLSFSGEEKFWVLELGINRRGDMEELGRILRPDTTLILNIGPCHLEGLKDEQGVARAKARVLDFMSAGKTCLASSDYPELIRELSARSHLQTVWFGISSSNAPCRAEYLGLRNGEGMYRVNAGEEDVHLGLPFFGEHLGESVAAAACAAISLGVSPQDLQKGLAEVDIPERRMQTKKTGNWLILDDSYNANPLSMRGAIQAAAEASSTGDLVLVLGEMGELGQEREELHRDLGEWIGESNCSAVFFAGPSSEDVMQGMPAKTRDIFFPVHSPQDFAEKWKRSGFQKGVVLFKGSRSIKMEDYLARFMALATTKGSENRE